VEFLHLGDAGRHPGVDRHHEAAGLFERLALLVHGHRDDHLPAVVPVDGLLLARVLDVEIDGHLDLPVVLLLLLHLARFFLGLARLFLELLADLGEGEDLVALVLEVDLVDLLLGKVHDLARVVPERGLAVALDGHGADDALLGRLAAEETHHLAHHPFELDERLLPGLHVGASRRGADEQTGECERDPQTCAIHRVTSGVPARHGTFGPRSGRAVEPRAASFYQTSRRTGGRDQDTISPLEHPCSSSRPAAPEESDRPDADRGRGVPCAVRLHAP